MEQQLTADSKADIDDWVLVKYDNLVFIGIKKDLSENKCKVKCMHVVKTNLNGPFIQMNVGTIACCVF